jgi:hypothetical protein
VSSFLFRVSKPKSHELQTVARVLHTKDMPKNAAKKQSKKAPKRQQTVSKKPQAKQRVKVPVIDPASPVLTGWPAIAHFLGQPIAVAQRWAKDGMPVERKGRYMTGSRDELSKWLGREAGTRQPVRITQTTDSDLLEDLRRGLKDLRTSRKK